MASSAFHLLLRPLRLLALLSLFHAGEAVSCFNSIFSVGDSLADTGNLLYAGNVTNTGNVGRLPYGETYFHHPTGRFSDGRIVIDFIAQGLGLPLVRPYLAGPGDHGFRQGANFAVGGATALDIGFFRAKGFNITWTEYSLAVQIQWFKKLLPSLCSSDSECRKFLNKSLFLVGEIGGNDFNFALMQQKSIDEITTYAPSVITAISNSIKALIDLGVKTLVVPGNFPIGCHPLYQTVYQSRNKRNYDPQTGCINWLNKLSKYHNHLLKVELRKLERLYPDAKIIYADYYEALLSVYRSPSHFGFKNPLVACCGAGGPHNVKPFVSCGAPKTTVCSDPSEYVSWDGLHLTEAAYNVIARGLLEGPYTNPPIDRACPRSFIFLSTEGVTIPDHKPDPRARDTVAYS